MYSHSYLMIFKVIFYCGYKRSRKYGFSRESFSNEEQASTLIITKSFWVVKVICKEVFKSETYVTPSYLIAVGSFWPFCKWHVSLDSIMPFEDIRRILTRNFKDEYVFHHFQTLWLLDPKPLSFFDTRHSGERERENERAHQIHTNFTPGSSTLFF